MSDAAAHDAAHPAAGAGPAAAAHDGAHAAEHAHGGGHGHGRGHGEHAESHGPGAPLWMLSFADMMTNLLCFFILLSAFASQQEGLLLEDGLGSIQESLVSMGLPGGLSGNRTPVQFNAGRVVYRPASSVNQKTLVDGDGRVLDANRDSLRAVVIDAMSRPGTSVLPTPLLFEAGSHQLSAGHRTFLEEVVRYVGAGRFGIRIDGYAFEEGCESEQGWLIAEARARAVRDFLASRGLAQDRLSWCGHGMLEHGPLTRAGAEPTPQNRFGRRAVLLTFLE